MEERLCRMPESKLLNQSINQSMTLAIDITDGRGLSNEACRELLPNKNKVMQC